MVLTKVAVHSFFSKKEQLTENFNLKLIRVLNNVWATNKTSKDVNDEKL